MADRVLQEERSEACYRPLASPYGGYLCLGEWCAIDSGAIHARAYGYKDDIHLPAYP